MNLMQLTTMAQKYKLIAFVSSVFLCTSFYAQSADSLATNEDEVSVDVQEDTVTSGASNGNNDMYDEYTTTGVSVSPAHFHLTQKPGESKTYSINVNNVTPTKKQFKVTIFDFNMNGKGKSAFLPPTTGEYSLSKWINISPTFIEVNANEKKQVKFTVDIPNDESGQRAAWCIIMLEQVTPRKTIDPGKSDKTIAFGVIPTFSFGVFIYQNPPNVINNKVEITDFRYEQKDSIPTVLIEAENKGDGIAYCTSYIDLTNMDTGEQERLTVKRFTIVPGLVRDFVFPIPKKIKNGNYLAIGVLDYESSEEIQAAKLQFELKK